MSSCLFINGKVVTMEPGRPVVPALFVSGDKIGAAGEVSELARYQNSETSVVDLAGQTVVPGFHDSHAHLGQTGFALDNLNLEDVGSLEVALRRIEEAALASEPGVWVTGAGFLLERWGRPVLSYRELDCVSPRNPVAIYSQDRHSMWVNSFALELAGIDAKTVDPIGGVIVRDDTGAPSGMLLERAQDLAIREFENPSPRDIASAMRKSARHFAAHGVTTVHQMGFEPVSYWRTLATLASEPDFPVRVWSCVMEQHIDSAINLGLATGQGGANFQVGGAKFVADGALGSLTAHMIDPYGEGTDRGIELKSAEQLIQDYAKVSAAGFAPVTHAIGDAANRAVLNALQQTSSIWKAQGLRPRVEHVQHIHPDDVVRFRELGVVASMQPIHFTLDAERIYQLLGDREKYSHAWRTLLDEGVKVCFGSDSPVASANPLRGMEAAVKRIGETGRKGSSHLTLSVMEALSAYTTGAAYAIGWERRSGRLWAGYDADLVVLSGDPFGSLETLEVQATMKGGEWTYQKVGASLHKG